MAVTARAETQFGTAKDVGSTYTSLGTIAGGKEYNLHLNCASLLAGAGTTVKVRVYIATTGWSAGEPSGSTKVGVITRDLKLTPDVPTVQLTGVVLIAGQQLVVWADQSNAADFIASGMDITL